MTHKSVILKILPFYFLLIFLLGFFSFLQWDENTYLSNARIGSDYREDFRFPLLSFVLKGIFFVTGESLFVAKLFMALVTTLSVYLFFLLAKDLIPRYANTATFLFAFNPLTLLWGGRVYTEFLGVFFVLLSFYLFRRKSLFFYILSGVSASLAFLSRFTFGFWAVSLALVLLFGARSIKKKNFFLSFCLGFVIPLLPWLLYHYFVHGSMFWNFVQQYTIVQSSQVQEPVYLQLFNLLLNFHLLALLAVVGIYQKFQDRAFLPLTIFVVLSTIHLLFFVASKAVRYWIGVLPFIILFALSFRVRRSFLVAAVAGTLLISSVLVYEDFSGCHSSVDDSIVYVGENTGGDDVIVSNFWPYFGYSLDLESYSMYGSKEVLRHRHVPKYFIYHDSLGDPYDLDSLMSWDKLKLEKTFSDCEGSAYVFRVLY